jgi:hypothetical protein
MVAFDIESLGDHDRIIRVGFANGKSASIHVLDYESVDVFGAPITLLPVIVITQGPDHMSAQRIVID